MKSAIDQLFGWTKAILRRTIEGRRDMPELGDRVQALRKGFSETQLKILLRAKFLLAWTFHRCPQIPLQRCAKIGRFPDLVSSNTHSKPHQQEIELPAAWRQAATLTYNAIFVERCLRCRLDLIPWDRFANARPRPALPVPLPALRPAQTSHHTRKPAKKDETIVLLRATTRLESLPPKTGQTHFFFLCISLGSFFCQVVPCGDDCAGLRCSIHQRVMAWPLLLPGRITVSF